MYAQKKPIENTHIVRERDRQRFRELFSVVVLGLFIAGFLLDTIGGNETIIVIGVGIVVGLLAAFWLTRLLQKQLFEVSPADPIVFLGVVLLLLAVALLACLVPARRASRVNPMEALRYE